MYSVYVDDRSDYLVKSQIGCHIDSLCVSHVMYADDICLMAPSPAALQKLINICYDFSMQNNLLLNSYKSFCMVFKPRLYKLSSPSLYMSTEKLEYTNSTKYLGFTFGSDKNDDNDMLRQLRILYTKSNRILRLFNCCSIDVKLAKLAKLATVLVSIAHIYGLIIRSPLTVSLELLLTMFIAVY